MWILTADVSGAVKHSTGCAEVGKTIQSLGIAVMRRARTGMMNHHSILGPEAALSQPLEP